MKNAVLGLVVGMSLLAMTACGGSGGLSGNQPGAGSSDGSKQVTKEKIVLTQSTHGFLYTPIYIAQEKGYFAEEGLEVDVVVTGGGTKVVASVIGGSAQVGVTAVGGVLEAAEKGQNLQMFASLMNQFGSNIVIRKDVAVKKGITESSSQEEKIQALKGLKIAITSPGSDSDNLLRTLLKSQNINPEKDVELVPLGKPEAILPAFTNKQIDAFILSSPTSDIASMSDNGMMLFNLSKGEIKELDGILHIVMIGKKDVMEKNPQTFEKITRAIAKAEKFIASDKNGTKEILKKSLKSTFGDIDPKVFDATFENNYPAYSSNPVITKEGYNMNIKFGGINVPFEKVVTNKFAELAK